jgi:hypothetical protein
MELGQPALGMAAVGVLKLQPHGHHQSSACCG